MVEFYLFSFFGHCFFSVVVAIWWVVHQVPGLCVRDDLPPTLGAFQEMALASDSSYIYLPANHINALLRGLGPNQKQNQAKPNPKVWLLSLITFAAAYRVLWVTCPNVVVVVVGRCCFLGHVHQANTTGGQAEPGQLGSRKREPRAGNMIWPGSPAGIHFNSSLQLLFPLASATVLTPCRVFNQTLWEN